MWTRCSFKYYSKKLWSTPTFNVLNLPMGWKFMASIVRKEDSYCPKSPAWRECLTKITINKSQNDNAVRHLVFRLWKKRVKIKIQPPDITSPLLLKDTQHWSREEHVSRRWKERRSHFATKTELRKKIELFCIRVI